MGGSGGLKGDYMEDKMAGGQNKCGLGLHRDKRLEKKNGK